MFSSLFGNKGPVISEIVAVNKYVDYPAFYPFHQKSRLTHGLIFAIEGQENYRIGDLSFTTNPGDVFYLPKSLEYRITMKGEKCTVICIDFETVDDFPAQYFFITPKNNNLSNLFFSAEHIWKVRKVGFEFESMSIAYKILAEIQMQADPIYYQSKKKTQIQAIVDYLNYHFNESDLKVENIASHNGFHPRYFAKIFFEIYGVSPKKYLTTLRMEKARELLLSSRYSVNQISQMTGYSDIFYFSKAFKKEYGLSPSEYKKSR